MVQLRKTSYIDQLKVDQAILNVTSVSSNKSLWLYQLSDECVQVRTLEDFSYTFFGVQPELFILFMNFGQAHGRTNHCFKCS